MLPAFTSNSPATVEELVEFEDSVKSFSNEKLSCLEVSGKHACSKCRYIISKGRDGSAPNIYGAFLSEPLDRCLLDCVPLCLDAKCYESPFLKMGRLQWSDRVMKLLADESYGRNLRFHIFRPKITFIVQSASFYLQFTGWKNLIPFSRLLTFSVSNLTASSTYSTVLTATLQCRLTPAKRRCCPLAAPRATTRKNYSLWSPQLFRHPSRSHAPLQTLLLPVRPLAKLPPLQNLLFQQPPGPARERLIRLQLQP